MAAFESVDDHVLTEDDDYMDVREAVSDVLARWRHLAGALGVKPGQTSTIEASNRGAVERCMEESLLVWLRRAHNEKKRGPPSWRALVKAIAASAGGNNPASAMKLAAAHPMTSVSHPPVSDLATVSPETTTAPKPQDSLPAVPHMIHSSTGEDGVPVSIDAYGIKLTRFPPHDLSKRSTSLEFSFGTVQVEYNQQKRVIESYAMNPGGTHGICAIVNNEKFSSHSERVGTRVDEANLTQCFRYLGYTVEVYRDLTAHQIESVFRYYRECNHTHHDSFVVCILSHGEEGQIFGTDSKVVRLQSIVGQLTAESCGSLAGKPKLFFIQACRGTDTAVGTELASDSGSQPLPQTTQPIQPASVRYPITIPSDADFFFGYATPPGNVSWRNTAHGSWYISEICQVFGRLARFVELKSLVTKVHNEVGTGYKNGNYRQAPEMTSRLRKDVYFFD